MGIHVLHVEKARSVLGPGEPGEVVGVTAGVGVSSGEGGRTTRVGGANVTLGGSVGKSTTPAGTPQPVATAAASRPAKNNRLIFRAATPVDS